MITGAASGHLWLQVWHWPWQPPAVLAALALGWLYAAGLTRMVGTVTVQWLLRVLSFCASLAITEAALESPARLLARTSFVWNLAPQLLLLLAAAPLAVAAAPWPVLRAGLPSYRLRYGTFPVRQRWTLLTRRRPALRALGHPRAALLTFLGSLWLAHMPGMFGVLLRHPLAEEAASLGYLVVGLWFWSHLIASPPLPGPPPYRVRMELIGGGLFACWVAGAALLLAGSKSDPSYLPVPGVSAHQALDALHEAGAILLGPVMLPFDLVLTVTIISWLVDSGRVSPLPGAGPAGRAAP